MFFCVQIVQCLIRSCHPHSVSLSFLFLSVAGIFEEFRMLCLKPAYYLNSRTAIVKDMDGQLSVTGNERI